MSTEDPRFAGIARLYGLEGMQRLRDAHVAIVGVGGVGSWAAEAIARTGVGEISLFDLDDVCVSNANRQLHALDSTVGKPKVEVMAERLRGINPGCTVHAVADFVTRDTMAEYITPNIDCVIDCIDSVNRSDPDSSVRPEPYVQRSAGVQGALDSAPRLWLFAHGHPSLQRALRVLHRAAALSQARWQHLSAEEFRR